MRTPFRILFAVPLLISVSSLICYGAETKTADKSSQEKTTSKKAAPDKSAAAPAKPAADWEKYVVAAPDVVYPESIKRHGTQGIGSYLLTIDQKNGEVTEVKVVKSTGFRKLDALYVMNFFQWRFRPGTIKSAQVPAGVTVYGRSRGYHSGRY